VFFSQTAEKLEYLHFRVSHRQILESKQNLCASQFNNQVNWSTVQMLN